MPLLPSSGHLPRTDQAGEASEILSLLPDGNSCEGAAMRMLVMVALALLATACDNAVAGKTDVANDKTDQLVIRREVPDVRPLCFQDANFGSEWQVWCVSVGQFRQFVREAQKPVLFPLPEPKESK
jgi:hypothetical protein